MTTKLVAELKEEHQRILSILRDLSSYTNGDNVAKANVIAFLREMKSMVTHHINIEQKYLYPKIMAIEGDINKAEISQVKNEMDGVSTSVMNFYNKYTGLRVSQLEADEQFRKELKEISLVVEKRITKEEDFLFPIFEKFCDDEGIDLEEI